MPLSTGPISAPLSGSWSPMPGLCPPWRSWSPATPPLGAPMVMVMLVLVLVLWVFRMLANTPVAAWKVLAGSFSKLSEGARSKLRAVSCARTGSDHAPVARIVAAGTCADTLNLRRAIAGNRREPVLLT